MTHIEVYILGIDVEHTIDLGNTVVSLIIMNRLLDYNRAYLKMRSAFGFIVLLAPDLACRLIRQI